jgi:protein-serine/threonine kinase
MQNEVNNKRSTIIGTPQWMPPEMWISSDTDPLHYGSEVDIWSFGCIVYEMATGLPPNARVAPQMLHKVLTKAPTLEDDRHSDDVKEFTAFCLQLTPEERPSAEEILQHPFVSNSWRSHPTSSLSQLLEHYAMWEEAGNQRLSLFNAAGAQVEDIPSRINDDMWNFSTTEDFARKINHRVSTMIETYGQNPDELQLTDNSPRKSVSRAPGRLTQADMFINEQRIKRGQEAMLGLFDHTAAPYQYGGAMSDLPLRNMSSDADANRLTMIDLDDAGMVYEDQNDFRLEDPQTIRASRFGSAYADEYDDEDFVRRQSLKRATMGWQFPGAQDTSEKRSTMGWKFPGAEEPDKRATLEWTFPGSSQETDKRATLEWKFPGGDSGPKRATKDFKFPAAAEQRKTLDWEFPIEEEPEFETQRFSPGPTQDDYDFPVTQSAPLSPNRESMIDLDDAAYPSQRPSTAGSEAKSFTTDKSANPFDLESEVEIAKRRTNRTSMHTKSQSEPLSHPALPSELSHTALAEQEGEQRLSGVSQAPVLSTKEQYQKDRLQKITTMAMAYLNEDTATQAAVLKDMRSSQPQPPPLGPKYLARSRALNMGLSAIIEQEVDPKQMHSHLEQLARENEGQPLEDIGVFRDNTTGRMAMHFPRPRQPDPETLEHGASEIALQEAFMKASAGLLDAFNSTRAALAATEKTKRR